MVLRIQKYIQLNFKLDVEVGFWSSNVGWNYVLDYVFSGSIILVIDFCLFGRKVNFLRQCR